jgi:2C-methyl-D-erythritol 2,4-cyclodiphosphate synthase
MQAEIARLLGLPLDAVSIKAKTGEGVDAVGRGEAVACTAVAGLARKAVGSRLKTEVDGA